jgi:hypothetical protein
MRRFVFCLAPLVTASLGCTPAGLYGNEARYAPDQRGYVVARSLGSEDRLVLSNPITGKKIRCREQLEPYFAAVTRETATRMHDENVAAIAALPESLLLLPVGLIGGVLVVGHDVFLAPPQALNRLMSSPSADSLYESGKRAFDEKRFSEAELLFERALGKRGANPNVQRSSYFLGILYEREGRSRDAVRAYVEFIERAVVRDEKAYAEAEEHLAALEPKALAPCRSQETLTFAWPAPR